MIFYNAARPARSERRDGVPYMFLSSVCANTGSAHVGAIINRPPDFAQIPCITPRVPRGRSAGTAFPTCFCRRFAQIPVQRTQGRLSIARQISHKSPVLRRASRAVGTPGRRSLHIHGVPPCGALRAALPTKKASQQSSQGTQFLRFSGQKQARCNPRITARLCVLLLCYFVKFFRIVRIFLPLTC